MAVTQLWGCEIHSGAAPASRKFALRSGASPTTFLPLHLVASARGRRSTAPRRRAYVRAAAVQPSGNAALRKKPSRAPSTYEATSDRHRAAIRPPGNAFTQQTVARAVTRALTPPPRPQARPTPTRRTRTATSTSSSRWSPSRTPRPRRARPTSCTPRPTTVP